MLRFTSIEFIISSFAITVSLELSSPAVGSMMPMGPTPPVPSNAIPETVGVDEEVYDPTKHNASLDAIEDKGTRFYFEQVEGQELSENARAFLERFEGTEDQIIKNWGLDTELTESPYETLLKRNPKLQARLNHPFGFVSRRRVDVGIVKRESGDHQVIWDSHESSGNPLSGPNLAPRLNPELTGLTSLQKKGELRAVSVYVVTGLDERAPLVVFQERISNIKDIVLPVLQQIAEMRELNRVGGNNLRLAGRFQSERLRDKIESIRLEDSKLGIETRLQIDLTETSDSKINPFLLDYQSPETFYEVLINRENHDIDQSLLLLEAFLRLYGENIDFYQSRDRERLFQQAKALFQRMDDRIKRSSDDQSGLFLSNVTVEEVEEFVNEVVDIQQYTQYAGKSLESFIDQSRVLTTAGKSELSKNCGAITESLGVSYTAAIKADLRLEETIKLLAQYRKDLQLDGMLLARSNLNKSDRKNLNIDPVLNERAETALDKHRRHQEWLNRQIANKTGWINNRRAESTVKFLYPNSSDKTYQTPNESELEVVKDRARRSAEEKTNQLAKRIGGLIERLSLLFRFKTPNSLRHNVLTSIPSAIIEYKFVAQAETTEEAASLARQFANSFVERTLGQTEGGENPIFYTSTSYTAGEVLRNNQKWPADFIRDPAKDLGEAQAKELEEQMSNGRFALLISTPVAVKTYAKKIGRKKFLRALVDQSLFTDKETAESTAVLINELKD